MKQRHRNGTIHQMPGNESTPILSVIALHLCPGQVQLQSYMGRWFDFLSISLWGQSTQQSPITMLRGCRGFALILLRADIYESEVL